VTSLTLATILQLPFLATTTENYADAHQKTVETGQPLVVMVGADWCPACQMMEHQVIPVIRQRGIFRRVAFALVNVDRDREVGQNLTKGGPIPQLIVFRRTPDGWARTQLIGAQSVDQVEQFISTEVAQSDADHKALAKTDKAPKTKAANPSSPSSGKVAVKMQLIPTENTP